MVAIDLRKRIAETFININDIIHICCRHSEFDQNFFCIALRACVYVSNCSHFYSLYPAQHTTNTEQNSMVYFSMCISFHTISGAFICRTIRLFISQQMCPIMLLQFQRFGDKRNTTMNHFVVDTHARKNKKRKNRKHQRCSKRELFLLFAPQSSLWVR